MQVGAKPVLFTNMTKSYPCVRYCAMDTAQVKQSHQPHVAGEKGISY